MTSTNTLEFKGEISRHPVAELLLEFGHKCLTGSLRLSSGDKKSVVYFASGEIVFAVSNGRRFRLFEILLGEGQVSKDQLAEIEEFTNDIHLAKMLEEEGTLSKKETSAAFVFQITQLLQDAISWATGEFVFSASARLKSDIHFEIETDKLLQEYAAGLEDAEMMSRMSSSLETLRLREGVDLQASNLKPEEAFVLSRILDAPLGVDMIQAMCGFTLESLVPMLYRLWFRGYVDRLDWASAISAEDSSKLSATSFELKQAARSFEEEREIAKKEAEEKAKKDAENAEKAARARGDIPVEEYLEIVEKAGTHYEMFSVSPDAKIAAIKRAYFSLAKRFHPDLFYRTVDGETHERVQSAFTEIARAYETLKNEESREVYDFKLGKVIEQLRKADSAEKLGLTKEDIDSVDNSTKAADNFNAGYDYLFNDNVSKALPYLARAVHIDSTNARYHAFYGRALTFDSKTRKKAESELQEAIKIDPKNGHFRLMLAELFVEIGHKVRARSELNRVLELDSKNHEAQAMLDTLAD